jgi:hypothetical protein
MSCWRWRRDIRLDGGSRLMQRPHRGFPFHEARFRRSCEILTPRCSRTCFCGRIISFQSSSVRSRSVRRPNTARRDPSPKPQLTAWVPRQCAGQRDAGAVRHRSSQGRPSSHPNKWWNCAGPLAVARCANLAREFSVSHETIRTAPRHVKVCNSSPAAYAGMDLSGLGKAGRQQDTVGAIR